MMDFERLLAPITLDSPAGESLRYEGTYDLIQSARREDDPALPQGIWQTALKKADWAAVRELCIDALETRSKDLQLAAWLLEASIHLDGIEGAREGFAVLTGLCTAFWQDLYPALDPDDSDSRVAPVQWINEKLSLKLKQIAITKPLNGELPQYKWADWESARHLDTLGQRDKGAVADAEMRGQPTQAKLLSAVDLTANEFYVDLLRQLEAATEAVNEFDSVLNALMSGDGATLHQFKETLSAIDRFVKDILRQRGHFTSAPAAVSESESNELESIMPDQEEPISTGARIRSRAQAYQLLSEAAEYLIRTEPHSPTPYLVKRAVAWGGMNLSEVLQQLMRNPGELNEIYKLLGINDTLPNR